MAVNEPIKNKKHQNLSAKTFKTIDDYINAQPERTKKMLQELKECILKAAPNTEQLLATNKQKAKCEFIFTVTIGNNYLERRR